MNNILLWLSGCILIAGLSACSNQPIIDTRGVNMAQYREDLAQCEAIADQVQIANQAAGRAAVGAVVGAAVGAAIGNSDTAARSAGVGAVVGGARGTERGVQERKQVVRNCLRNRGYAVLN